MASFTTPVATTSTSARRFVIVLEIILIAAFGIGSCLAGYALGRYHERQAATEAAERMLRLDPPRRTAGAPTNLDAPPSGVDRPKWRSGTFKSGPRTDV